MQDVNVPQMPQADEQIFTSESFTWTVVANGEAETSRLARHLASFVRPGDLITLSGGLGVGKTSFARGLIRAVLREPAVEVPSPTFTLMQVYEGENFPVIHADLFRLQSRAELEALGWEEMSENALVLVEWPERAGVDTAAERLDVTLALSPAVAVKASDERIVTFTGSGAWRSRLRLVKAASDLLAARGWNEAKREFIQGDASTRAYERLRRQGETAILMISPPRPDGPPLRDGRPYSAIAKLAERAEAFVAMAQGLAEIGYSSPKILGRDLDEGVLIIEDLGEEGVVDAKGPIAERYALATELLADLHRRALPESLPIDQA